MRHSAEYEVIEWLGEQSAADRPHELVRPDGLATLASPERRLTFVLELDRGTERGDRLEHKLLRYLRVARLQGAPDACLFLFPSEKRERLVARRLDPVGSMPVPTSYTGLYELDPLGAVWLPLGYDHRGRLIDLPSHREVIT
jgi:hypothetical protein